MALQVVKTEFKKVTLYQIVEIEIGGIVQEIITDATPDALSSIAWLGEPYVSPEGEIRAIVQCFVFDFGERKLVIDTCIGNDKDRQDVPEWGNLSLRFIDTLSSIGVEPSSVSDVLCTHLHMDHVGWNTYRDGHEWKPTFPNAKYYFGRKEYEYWQGKPEGEIRDDHMSFDDSVQPIVDAGLSVLVEDDADLGGGVRLMPTHGHTPGHVSVFIDAGDNQIVVTGDALHHPCQIARPEWSTDADFNKSAAAETRNLLLKEWSKKRNLVLGSHFSIPSFGTVSGNLEDGYVFHPVALNDRE